MPFSLKGILSTAHADKMVGKSNKFDFSNRGSSGAKLGATIADTFRKDVLQCQKDVIRQLEKVRKRSMSGANQESGKEKDIGIHIIDFKAPNKDLGDEGVLAMVSGILEALKASSEATLCLEDVNLSGNHLTVISLAALAPIIKEAKLDVKTLDLSNNNFRVATREEALCWEQFISSFSCCFKLRKLDLSGNKELGSKALEIMARVYEAERPVDPLGLGGEGSVHSVADTVHSEDDAFSSHVSLINDRAMHSLTSACILRRRSGLRSLPYLDLTRTGLDDTGALWLSFIIPQHYYPNQLIDGINAAPASTREAIYSQARASNGIEWDMNSDAITKDGMVLLKKVEVIRLSLHDASPVPVIDEPDTEDINKSGNSSPVIIMPSSNPATASYQAAPTPRRASGKSSRNNSAIDDKAELNSLRHRLQRQIIAQQGASSVDLWLAALYLVSLSRRIFVFTRTSGQRSTVVKASKNGQTAYKSIIPVNPLELDSADLLPNTTKALIAVQKTGVTDITNKSKTPLLDQMRKPKYGAMAVANVTKRLGKSKLRGPSSQDFLDWQVKSKEKQGQRDSGSAGRLPYSVFNIIAQHTMKHDLLKVVTTRQRKACYTFGQNRLTLALEREWIKMNESAQILMLLNHLQCLAYEREES